MYFSKISPTIFTESNCSVYLTIVETANNINGSSHYTFRSCFVLYIKIIFYFGICLFNILEEEIRTMFIQSV